MGCFRSMYYGSTTVLASSENASSPRRTNSISASRLTKSAADDLLSPGTCPSCIVDGMRADRDCDFLCQICRPMCVVQQNIVRTVYSGLSIRRKNLVSIYEFQAADMLRDTDN